MTEGVHKVVPTVVFERDKAPVHHPVIHGVLESDAVRSKDVVLVTTICGLRGIGVVKARRQYNCGECHLAAKKMEVATT